MTQDRAEISHAARRHTPLFEQRDQSRVQIVAGTDDGYFAVREFGQGRLRVPDFFRDRAGVSDHAGVDRIGRRAAIDDRRSDGRDKCADVSRGGSGGKGCADGSATFVAEHQHKSHAQAFDRILDAAESEVLDEITRSPNDEESAEPLVEHEFRCHARIGAGDDDGERVLRGCALRALPGERLSGGHFGVHVTAVALEQFRECGWTVDIVGSM